MPIPIRLLLSLLPAVLAASCGWHLRGAASMPEGVETVYVDAPNRSLREAWTMQLSQSGVDVTDAEKTADARFEVDTETFDRRVLSVDPDTGKVREYMLAYTATVQLKRADGSILFEPQTVRQVRTYVFDEAAVVGSQNEQDALHREMRFGAVQQVLRRLQLAGCTKPGETCAR